jgi:hypothetical protein
VAEPASNNAHERVARPDAGKRTAAARDRPPGQTGLADKVGNSTLAGLLGRDDPPPGSPLRPDVRSAMERGFGRSFGHVRVHGDPAARAVARRLGARAFTSGRDVVVADRRSEGAPSVLAHELAHVVQQEGAPGGSPPVSTIDPPGHPAEREAAAASDVVTRGGRAPNLASAGGGIQRQADDAPEPGTPKGSVKTPPKAPAKGAPPKTPPAKAPPKTPPAPAKAPPSPTATPAPAAGPTATAPTTPAEAGLTLKVVAHGASTEAQQNAQKELEDHFGRLAPDNLAQLKSQTIELHIIPRDQKLVDLPEFSKLKGTKTWDGRVWDDVRGLADPIKVGSTWRFVVGEEELAGAPMNTVGAVIGGIVGGVLGTVAGAGIGVLIAMAAAKNFMPTKGAMLAGGIIGGALLGIGAAVWGAFLGGDVGVKQSGYGKGHVARHEGAHTVEHSALTPDQQTKVAQAYQDRKKAGGPWLPPEDYTSGTQHEYFANSVAAYFLRPPSSEKEYTPGWLRTNDPTMYEIVKSIYPEPAKK